MEDEIVPPMNSASSVMSMDSRDEDYLLKRINNFSEAEMRLLLQHIALVRPEVVRAALVHVTHDVDGDLHSVTTQQMNNTTKNKQEKDMMMIRGNSNNETSFIPAVRQGGEHPSKRSPGEAESDDDAIMPPTKQPSMPRSNMPPPHTQPSSMSRSNSSCHPYQHAIHKRNQEMGNIHSTATSSSSDATGGRPGNRRRHSDSSFTTTLDPPELTTSTSSTTAILHRSLSRQNSTKSALTLISEADSPTNRITSALGFCYLRYDPNSGGKLMIEYSKSPLSTTNNDTKMLLAHWTPQPPNTIPEFKFQGHASSELIGNCAAAGGRKNYYSGWCQFVRLAKSLNGFVTMLSNNDTNNNNNNTIIGVDLFAYVNQKKGNTTLKLAKSFSTQHLSAIACLPRHVDFYKDMRIDINKWMTEASTIGSATFLDNNTNNGNINTVPSTSAPPLSESSPRSNIRRLAPPQPHKGATPPPNRVLRAPSNSEMGTMPPIPTMAAPRGICYLLYDSNTGKLMLQYSKGNGSSSSRPSNAFAQWIPGINKRIQGFKYTQNHGRAELIGNCASGVAGRKNYYSGCCQFVKYAYAMQGTVTFQDYNNNNKGLPIDMYVYYDDKSTQFLQPGQSYNLQQQDNNINKKLLAVACLPKNSDFYDNTITVDIAKWMTEAATQGAASQL